MVDLITGKINLTTLDEKVLIVPPSVNSAILKRNLALRAGSINNFKCMSLRNFLADSVVIALPEKRLISNDERFWLFYKVLSLNKEKLDYFREVTDFDGFVRLLSTTTEELQLNGVEKHHFPEGKKGEEIFFLMEEYEKLKVELWYIDYPDALDYFIRHKPSHQSHYYFIRWQFTARERDFLVSLGFEELIEKHPQEKVIPRFDAYKVDTPYQETLQTIRNILSDIKLQDKTKPLKIGVIVDNYTTYYGAFRGVLKHLKMEKLIYFSKGIPLFTTSAGKQFAYYLEWMKNSFSVYRWLKILESSSFARSSILKEGDSVGDFFKALQLIRDTKLVLFDEQSCKSMRYHLEGTEKYMGEEEVSDNLLDQRINRQREIATKLVDIFQDIAIAKTPSEKLNQLVIVFRKFTLARDYRTIDLIDCSLTNLLSQSELLEHKSLGELVEMTISIVNEIKIKYEAPAFESAVMGTIDDLYYLGMDKLYILGLSEKGLPKKNPENPLLLDEEKEIIYAHNSRALFYTTSGKKAHADQTFWDTIFNSNEIVMSVPIKNITSGKDWLVSRYLLEAYEKFMGARLDFKAVSKKLDESPKCGNNFLMSDPADSFYDYETASSVLLGLIDKEAKNKVLSDYFTFAKKANEYKKAKRNALEFDEYLGALNLPLDRDLKPVSPSGLTNWVFCPYQYFLKNEMRLKRDEDFSTERLKWLDNKAFGIFIHEVFYKFGTMMKTRNGGNSFNKVTEDDRVIIEKAFEITFNEFKRLNPVISEVYFKIQEEELRNIINRFFEFEKETNSKRLYFELSAGLPNREGRDLNIFKEDSVTIELNDGIEIKVRGSIDRVDYDGGNFIIYDYKTGKPKEENPKNPFESGEHIQAGLYPLMASGINSKIEPGKFIYWYTSKQGDFHKLIFDSVLKEEDFLQVITPQIKEIKRGNFVPVGSNVKNPPCKNCDFVEICVGSKSSIINRLKKTDLNFVAYNQLVKR